MNSNKYKSEISNRNIKLKEQFKNQTQSKPAIESPVKQLNFKLPSNKSRSISTYNQSHKTNRNGKRQTIEFSNRRKFYENLTLNMKSSTYECPVTNDDLTPSNIINKSSNDNHSNYASKVANYKQRYEQAAQQEPNEQKERKEQQYCGGLYRSTCKYMDVDLHALRDFRLQHIEECFGKLHRYKLQKLQQQQADIQQNRYAEETSNAHYCYDYPTEPPTSANKERFESGKKQREHEEGTNDDSYSLKKSTLSSCNSVSTSKTTTTSTKLTSKTVPYQYRQRELRELLLKSASENDINNHKKTTAGKSQLYKTAQERGFNKSLALSYQPMY